MFLTNGMRGPFYRSDHYTPWNMSFVTPHFRDNRTALLGTSVSCEVHFHFGTDWFVLKRFAINSALSLWSSCLDMKKYSDVIINCEVGLTTKMLNSHWSVKSMVKGEKTWNENVCESRKAQHLIQNPNKKLQDPFEIMFVKLGGWVYRARKIPNDVIDQYENATREMNSRALIKI